VNRTVDQESEGKGIKIPKRAAMVGGVTLGLIAVALVTAVVVLPALGFGQNRTALARQATVHYWSLIGHGKLTTAYHMMTSGNRQSITESDYQQNLYNFLTSVGNVWATTGKVDVNGDQAVVAVALHSPKTSAVQKGFQHLYWQDGGWKITDENGGISLHH
jgi:hypothetical protein